MKWIVENKLKVDMDLYITKKYYEKLNSRTQI
jgi:hypothetical protein